MSAGTQQLDIALVLAAGTVLLLGLTIGWVRNRLWISEPILALGIGVVIGPVLRLGGFADHDGSGGVFLEEAARITLALAVMGAALRLPRSYGSRSWRTVAMVLGLGMPLMWLFASLAAWALLPVSVLQALLVGAVLTPTDPVVAAGVISGVIAERCIPARLRNMLTAESGGNDGLAQLFVLLPVLLLTETTGRAVTEWLTAVLLWQILGAFLIGGVIGWVAGRLLVWARRDPTAERQSTLTTGIALSLAVLGTLELLGTNGFFGVFAAGLMLNRALPEDEKRAEHVQEAISRFFDLPVFILLGIILPVRAWGELGWPAFALALLLLAVRRPPAFWLLRRFVPAVVTRREALFAGWFGPMGISSVYYALLAGSRTGWAALWPIVSLVVVVSIVAHGVSATPLSRALGRAEEADGDGADAGLRPAPR